MRLLQCGGHCHPKNLEGIRLMTAACGIEYVLSNHVDHFKEKWDFVFIPSGYIPPEQFPKARVIIYGPHNFVFPTRPWITMHYSNIQNVYYNTLSIWNTNVYKAFGFQSNFNMVELPFAVNLERFTPAQSKIYERDCFLYFKDTNPVKLKWAEEVCRKYDLKYTIVTYGRYKENDYVHLLNTSKFGIWIGRHESQGFALQEALAMNVPLVVWDVKSMFEEVVSGKAVYEENRERHALESSCIPYWDSTCGLVVNGDTLEGGIRTMSNEYSQYRPREFIERVLGPVPCMERWIELHARLQRQA